MSAGWWIVIGTAVAALLLLGGALAALAVAVALTLETRVTEIHPSEGVSVPPLR